MRYIYMSKYLEDVKVFSTARKAIEYTISKYVDTSIWINKTEVPVSIEKLIPMLNKERFIKLYIPGTQDTIEITKIRINYKVID